MKTANIIGKGGSLQYLRQSDLPRGFTIGICEATKQVKCNAGFQGDIQEGIKIEKNNVLEIWTAPNCPLYPGSKKITWDEKKLGLYPPSAVVLIDWLKKHGYEKVNLFCFDALAFNVTSYPPYPIVKHTIDKHGDPYRYLTQRKKLDAVLEHIQFEFITPEPTTDILIPTMNRPADFQKLSAEIIPLLTDREQIYCVATAEKDFGTLPEKTSLLITEPRGACQAMHTGLMTSKAKWVVYLNDDISFQHADWLSIAKDQRRNNPDIKLFSFCDYQSGEARSVGRWAAFGMIERAFYVSNYCDGNPFKAHAWDNEIQPIAEQLNAFKYLSNVRLDHYVDLIGRDGEQTIERPPSVETQTADF